MIMKANKQIGFIYKDNESIDKILKDGDVVFERGFLREKTSTTLPINFGGVGKDLKDYRVYGNTVQSKLPSGYTQVDYIESSGTQYIDTGFKPDQDTKIETKLELLSRPNLYSDFFGARESNTKQFHIIARQDGMDGRYGTGQKIFEKSEIGLHNIIFNKNSLTIDNITETYSQQTFSSNYNAYIFGVNNTGSLQFPSILKLYTFKIYNNDVMIRNFIPCYRNSDNEVGLYDLVNNVFYTNQGTGSFTYGSVAPTPDAPIEMVSCGDRTKNLFDKNNANILNGYINNSTSVITSDTNSKSIYISCKPNTTYTIQKILTTRFRVGYSSSTPEIGTTISGIISNYDGTSITITTGDNAQYLVAWIYQTETTPLQNVLDSIQIEEGSTATPYEPYYDGYKIPVNVRSENLFNIVDYSNIDLRNNGNATHTSETNKFKITTGGSSLNSGVYIRLADLKNYVDNYSDNKTYYISFDIIAGRKITMNIGTTNSRITPTIGVSKQRIYVNTLIDSNFVIYSSSNIAGVEIEISNIMVSESNESYQPYYNETTNIYLDEPLRKIDGYSDYIDFANGKVVKNIKEVALDGSESWASASASGNYSRFVCNAYNDALIPIDLNTIGNILSDKFIPRTANETANAITGIAIAGNGRFVIYYDLTKDYTTTQFKTWLFSHNVIVDYVLETPTEELITLPNIPTIDENNTLNIETEITPSQVYIKYKSNE